MNAQSSWTSHNIPTGVLGAVLTASREAELTERRSADRFPFFVQMTLAPTEPDESNVFAYSRDISVCGLGLLHTVPLPIGSVYEVAAVESRFPLRQFAEVLWCRSAGHGWYLSGWRFMKSDE